MDDGNNRVTLAVLGAKLDSLAFDVRSFHDETCKRCDAHDTRLRAAEQAIVSLKTLQDVRLGISTAISVVAAAIAAVFRP